MIGFTPGFPYLGEVPKAIETPRRETPRTVVPRGSVAIAQKQTGIYTVQSPGGWHILGWTPLKLFDAGNRPPMPLELGDLVKFFSVPEEEIGNWGA
jgi:KipI family sensor histidine kinase inhibitor